MERTNTQLHKYHKYLCFLLLSATILTNILAFIGTATPHWVSYFSGFLPSQTALMAERVIQLIPSNASILTNSHIFPLVSSRLNAYTYPATLPDSNVSFFEYIASLVEKCDYVLLDLNNFISDPVESLILSYTTDFGVVVSANNLLLLKRGYSEGPLIFIPVKYACNYANMTLKNGILVSDPEAYSEKVLCRTGLELEDTDFWWGPYLLLPPGTYEAKIRAKVLGTVDSLQSYDTVLNLEAIVHPLGVKQVVEYQGNIHLLRLEPISPKDRDVIKTIDVNYSALKEGEYTTFSFTFDAKEYGYYEVIGKDTAKGVQLFLDMMEVQQIVPLSSYNQIYVQLDDIPGFHLTLQHLKYILAAKKLIDANSLVFVPNELQILFIKDHIISLGFCDGNITTITDYLRSESMCFEYIDKIINCSDYILLDWRISPKTYQLVLSRPFVSAKFGLIYWADGVALLKREYKGPLLIYEPLKVIIEPSDVLPKSARMSDRTMIFNGSIGDDFWLGPYLRLPPGVYEAKLRIRAESTFDHTTASNIFILEVNVFLSKFKLRICRFAEKYYFNVSVLPTAEKIQLTSFSITNLSDVTIIFEVKCLGIYELPCRYVQTTVPLYFDGFTINMIRPTVTLDEVD